jgi:hypothetical protein
VAGEIHDMVLSTQAPKKETLVKIEIEEDGFWNGGIAIGRQGSFLSFPLSFPMNQGERDIGGDPPFNQFINLGASHKFGLKIEATSKGNFPEKK